MTKTDVLLIGAGIMSATLGTLLRLVEPNWSITLVERLDGVAAESSDPWNNAGTGHYALCELKYTPQAKDGSIDTAKAVFVNEQFQVSRQLWAHAVERGVVTDPRSFINPVPHVSFVHGAERVDYLRRRREALVANPLLASTTFIDDADEFVRRVPLMAERRDPSVPVAELDGRRHRRRLRVAVEAADRLRRPHGHHHFVRTRRTRTFPGFGRQLDGARAQPAYRRLAKDPRPSSSSAPGEEP